MLAVRRACCNGYYRLATLIMIFNVVMCAWGSGTGFLVRRIWNSLNYDHLTGEIAAGVMTGAPQDRLLYHCSGCRHVLQPGTMHI